jgi:hypothetical protein
MGWGAFPLQADETILAWMGVRVAGGAVPYRDCLTFIPPLIPGGIALWFKTFGASLASLRVLQLFFGAALSGFLCWTLVQRGFRPAWAAAGALVYGWLAFAVWPLPSHHYAAAAFALAALSVGGAPESARGPGRAFASGFLGGLCGLALQTEGALALGWLFLKPWGPRPWKARGWIVLGASIPVGAAFGALAAMGALVPAFKSLVLHPLLYYRQSGGFNDVSLAGACRSWFEFRLAAASGISDHLYLLGTALLLLTLPLALVSLAARAAVRHDLPSLQALARGLLLAAVSVGGRADPVHLAFFFPFALLSLAEGCQGWGRGETPRCFAMGWASLLLLLGLMMWCGRWGGGAVRWPPDLRGADSWLKEAGPASVVRELPDAGRSPPLVALPYGSFVYLAYAPDPPPVDWIYPRSLRSNAPWEYAVLAKWMVTHRPPFVLLNRGYERAFLDDTSPLGEVLRTRYEPLKETRWGQVLGARSEEQGVRSKEQGARSEEREVRSEEQGARSEE